MPDPPSRLQSHRHHSAKIDVYKRQELHSPELVLDTSAPEIKMNITTKSGEPVNYGNYQEYGYWFSKEPVTARIQVTDPLSGIGQAEVVVLDADGEVVQKEADVPNGQTPCWEQSIVLSDNGSEFDGTIIVNVKDRLENTDAQSGSCLLYTSLQKISF